VIFLELKFPQSLTGKNLENAAYSALEQSGKQDDDLTLVLTGDEELRRLNLEYTGNDSTTDVLSFPANETDPETGRCYLGDVIISLPRAADQAEAGGHTLDTE
jgi:ssRNA-specific RNase YbeY (16S rRNA maturation enzyme)